MSGEQLLDALFDDKSRPSIRWLRTQTKNRTFPVVRIGHLVFFDEEMVRTKLARKNMLLARHEARAAALA